MRRDINRVIERVRRFLPAVEVRQHWVRNPGMDDDGVWWFSLPGVPKQIQVESTFGLCPFQVETDDMRSGADALTASTIDAVVGMVVSYLRESQAGSTAG